MSETKPVQTEAVEANDDAAKVLNQAKGFWEKFSKPVIYGGTALIVLLGGYFGYKKLVLEPKEEKANDAIWHAQQYFEMDSLKLALNGDGQNPGFEKIAKNFSGTKAGELANFYAGVCALKLEDFKKAENYLKDFSTDSKDIQASAYRCLGDAYSEQKKNEEAIKQYEKAGRHFPEDESLSAQALFRAGQLSEIMGKNDAAIKYYKEVKEKYSRTDVGYKIDQYLAKLGVTE